MIEEPVPAPPPTPRPQLPAKLAKQTKPIPPVRKKLYFIKLYFINNFAVLPLYYFA